MTPIQKALFSIKGMQAYDNPEVQYMYDDVITMLNSLLSHEKTLIEDAYKQGYNDSHHCEYGKFPDYQSPEHYAQCTQQIIE